MTPSGVWPGSQRAKVLNGIMVSCAVLTEVPAEALECPLAASELIARLRAESAAISAAVVATLEVLEVLEPPDAEPAPPAPAPAAPAIAKGVAAGVAGEPLIVVVVLVLLVPEAVAAAVETMPTVGVLEGGGGWVGVAVPPAVTAGPMPAAVVAGFDEPPPELLELAELVAVETVPATALVDCVPLGVPPEVLTYNSSSVSGYCQ